jgi:hypothetical protein
MLPNSAPGAVDSAIADLPGSNLKAPPTIDEPRLQSGTAAAFEPQPECILDVDLAGTFVGDSAILATYRDGIEIDVIDGADYAPLIGYGATAYQVTPWRTLLRDLTDNNADDFDNTGLPLGPDDFAGGFQWSATLRPSRQRPS